AEQLQRVDPRFHLSGFVSEERGSRPGDRQEFPGADWPRQFELLLWPRYFLRPHRQNGQRKRCKQEDVEALAQFGRKERAKDLHGRSGATFDCWQLKIHGAITLR